MTGLKLSLRTYGDADAAGMPLVLLHGLFGSAANWHGVARHLAQSRRVLVPDLRNHGRSPRSTEMSYPAMAGDVAELMDAERIDRALLVGHSMGGKVAMWLALTQPQRVHALVVADMAPVAYPYRFDDVLGALADLDLHALADRRAANARLALRLPVPGVRDYLLQNLIREAGGWRWRINLPALAAAMDRIGGFPHAAGLQYPGPALFVYGTESSYVTGAHLPAIRIHFPLARLRALPGAGHWVYSDRPDAFVRAVQGFLPA